MTAHVRRSASERGSMLVQVAVAMIVLIGFTAFVADYGLMWVARRQAQNAADAGALAGAIALGFDDFADRSSTGPAKQSAHNVALGNLVAAEAPKVDIDADVYFYPDAPAKFPAECADDTCIRVDVYRNQFAGNPLPVWFGQLVGLVNQGVQATAIARAAFGNATDCLKPWAVVDRWDEHWPVTKVWEFTDTFDKYDGMGNPDPAITTPDHYDPASVVYDDTDGDGEGDTPDWSTYQAGTGFHPFTFDGSGNVSGYTSDYGLEISLKLGDSGDWNFGAGWFMRLDFNGIAPTCPTGEGPCYEHAIKHCVGTTFKIGDEVPMSNSPGNMDGPTSKSVGGDGVNPQDVDSLYNQDPGAYWDETLNNGYGGVAGSAFAVSPRIVAVPLVNPDLLAAAMKQGGRKMVPISNIAGFFVKGVEGHGVNQVITGYLMTIPGLKTEGDDDDAPSTFMRTISLIR